MSDSSTRPQLLVLGPHDPVPPRGASEWEDWREVRVEECANDLGDDQVLHAVETACQALEAELR